MGSEKLGMCVGFCKYYEAPHPKRLCTGENWREQPQGEARCERTGNLCGSDTWMEGHSCPCKQCQAWLAAQTEGGEKPQCRWRYPQGTGEYLCCGYDEGHSVPHETVYVTHGSQTFRSNQELWYLPEPATPAPGARAQTEGGEKPLGFKADCCACWKFGPPIVGYCPCRCHKAKVLGAEDIAKISNCCVDYLMTKKHNPKCPLLAIEPSSPPATAGTCQKCGKSKFGPWSTICTADLGKAQEMYCQCGELFTVPTPRETEKVNSARSEPISGGQNFSVGATAVTAREFGATWEGSPTKTPFLFAEAYADQRVRQVRNKFCEVHQPDDLDSCPACEAVHQADLVEKLRQERDAQRNADIELVNSLTIEFNRTVSAEREARERAEKALREATEEIELLRRRQ